MQAFALPDHYEVPGLPVHGAGGQPSRLHDPVDQILGHGFVLSRTASAVRTVSKTSVAIAISSLFSVLVLDLPPIVSPGRRPSAPGFGEVSPIAPERRPHFRLAVEA